MIPEAKPRGEGGRGVRCHYQHALNYDSPPALVTKWRGSPEPRSTFARSGDYSLRSAAEREGPGGEEQPHLLSQRRRASRPTHSAPAARPSAENSITRISAQPGPPPVT